MTAEAMNIYGLEDLEKISVPPRSRLYHLKPRGAGAYIESLTSYIARLSNHHCLQPRTLILQEVLPLLRIPWRLKQENRLAWLKGSTGLNGMTSLVEDWVQALEELTFCNTLRFLTMLTWSNIAAQFGVVRKTRAWCPECYDEWLKTGEELYEPLIWTLQVIVKCPRHQNNLLCRCPFQDCQKLIPLLVEWSEPGCCPKCGRSLGYATRMENIQQTDIEADEQEWNSWVSGAVGELIAAAPGLGDPPRREIVASGITAYMMRVPGDSIEALAHSLGVSSLNLRGWQKGSHLPPFSVFLRLCKHMGMSPLSFLTRSGDDMEIDPLKMKLAGCFYIMNDGELQQRLEVILKSERFPFPSIQEVAKRLNLPAHVLEHKFPELCIAISQRYQEQLDADAQRVFLERVLIEAEMKHLSLNEVARRLGCRVTLLKYRFPELCKEIAQRYRGSLDLHSLKLSLDEIIAGSRDQPPRIGEVLLLLGCSSSTLYLRFPEACHTISRNHREWLVAQKPTRKKVVPTENIRHTVTKEQKTPQVAEASLSKKADKETVDYSSPLSAKSVSTTNLAGRRNEVDVDNLRRALELVLTSHEEPFPTVTEVAKRLGYSSSTLYHYFPEMCHAIAGRTQRVIELNDVRRVLEAMTEERKDANRQKRPEDLDRLQKALVGVLNGSSCPSMVEVAEHLGYSASSLYHYFPILCRAIAERHRQQKMHKLESFKRALEEVLACDQKPFPTMQEVAKQLGCHDVILYNHFPKLCHEIAKRHRVDLSYLQKSLEEILMSPDLPPSVSEVARRLACPVSVLRYHFPEQCKAIKERHWRLNEVETQRQALEAVASAKEVSLSVNEIARNLGCPSSVLYTRFPDLCREITERRWRLSNFDELRHSLEVALVEDPPPTLQEVARRIDCPVKNIEYYCPDLCKAIVRRHIEAKSFNDMQKALEAFLITEEPISSSEAARRIGVPNTLLRQRFPELSRSISARYIAYRKERHEARIQRIQNEIREAALLLHSQGTRPNTTRVGNIIGVPARFKMPEAREALHEVVKELGYEL